MTAAQFASGNLRKVCGCGSVIVWRADQAEPQCAFCPPASPPLVAGAVLEERGGDANATVVEPGIAVAPPRSESRSSLPPDRGESPERRYVYLLELVCLLCGRPVGNLLSDTPLPTTRSFVPATMRCRHCGGPPTFSGDVGRRITEEVHIEPSRLGRPPRALVEARKAGLAPEAISKWARSQERCSNCRNHGHRLNACPRPRRTVFRETVCVPGTTIALLSRPSKMPGPSWSIPAGPACPFAVTGPNSVCGSCYATKGNYTADPAIVRAQHARFDWARECMKTPDGVDTFVETMASAIAAADAGEYMRVHDSGDLFSPTYTRAWMRVCAALPRIRFWFPTRSWRAPWVSVIAELATLDNVTVRPSALYFDDAPPVVAGLHAGTTAKAEGFTCPAPRQAGACGDCRHCWDNKDQPVSYHAHFLEKAVAA